MKRSPRPRGANALPKGRSTKSAPLPSRRSPIGSGERGAPANATLPGEAGSAPGARVGVRQAMAAACLAILVGDWPAARRWAERVRFLVARDGRL